MMDETKPTPLERTNPNHPLWAKVYDDVDAWDPGTSIVPDNVLGFWERGAVFFLEVDPDIPDGLYPVRDALAFAEGVRVANAPYLLILDHRPTVIVDIAVVEIATRKLRVDDPMEAQLSWLASTPLDVLQVMLEEAGLACTTMKVITAILKKAAITSERASMAFKAGQTLTPAFFVQDVRPPSSRAIPVDASWMARPPKETPEAGG